MTDGTNFGVSEVFSAAGLVYDPGNQETSPGSKDMTTIAELAKAFGGGGDNPPGPGPDDPPTPGPGPGGDGDVPEPTSGILLMIGGAALALRRRR